MTDSLRPSFSDWMKKKKIHGKEAQENFLQSQPRQALIAELKDRADKFQFNTGKTKKTIKERGILKARKNLDFEPNTSRLQDASETVYERLLTASVANFYNQFSFSDKINIDLIKLNGNQITHICELKTVSNGFYYAVYELVYYYFLLRRVASNPKEFPMHLAYIHKGRPHLLEELTIKEPGLTLCVLVPRSYIRNKRKAMQFLEELSLLLEGNPQFKLIELQKDWGKIFPLFKETKKYYSKEL